MDPQSDTSQVVGLATLMGAVGQLMQPISDDMHELRAYITIVVTEFRKEQQAQRRDIDHLQAQYCGPGTSAIERLSKMELRLRKTEDLLQEFQQVIKVLKYLGLVFGSAILALIWGMITGQVTVTFN